jgi:hypothetical protein
MREEWEKLILQAYNQGISKQELIELFRSVKNK